MKRKATLFSLILAATFLAASSSPAEAGIAKNKRSSNGVELNKREFNRLAGNDINTNKREFNSVRTAAALPQDKYQRIVGDGAVMTISTIELADGTRIHD